jgi:predicted DNA-binding transcriptional regulator AlpA
MSKNNSTSRALGQRTLIRPSEIQSVYGVSRSSAYLWMGQGKFPKLVHLSPRCRAWRKADLDAHFGLTGDNR